MSLTGVNTHLQAAFDAGPPVPFVRNAFSSHATSTLVTVESSMWFAANGFPGAGSIPPTGAGAACDRNTPGAIPLPDAVVGKKIYANSFNMLSAGQAVFKLYDRMFANSGLVGTTAGASPANDQAVNSAALPARAGTGRLVFPYAEVYVATGAGTISTFTLKYTNHLGVPNRVGTTTTVLLNGIGRFIPLNMQAGDIGIQSIEAVNLSVSTGAPAGNFGITLARLVAWQPASGSNFLAYPQNTTEQGGAQVDDNACLMVTGHYQAAATTIINGQFQFIQG